MSLKRSQIRNLQKSIERVYEEVKFIKKGTGSELSQGGDVVAKLPPTFLNQSRDIIASLYGKIGNDLKKLAALVQYDDPNAPVAFDTLFHGQQALEDILNSGALTSSKVSLLRKQGVTTDGFLKRRGNQYVFVVDLHEMTVQYFRQLREHAEHLAEGIRLLNLSQLRKCEQQLRRQNKNLIQFVKSQQEQPLFRTHADLVAAARQDLILTQKQVTERIDALSSFEIIKEGMVRLKNLTANMSLELKKIERLRGDLGQKIELEVAESSFQMTQEQSKLLLLEITNKYLEFPEHKQKALHDKNLILKLQEIKKMFDLEIKQSHSLETIQKELSALI